MSKHKGSHYGSIRFNDKTRCLVVQFTPGNLFIGHGTRIGTIAGGGVGNLAEISPKGRILHFQVLRKHRHYTDGEIACNTASDLKKTYSLTTGIFNVPVSKPNHIFYAR